MESVPGIQVELSLSGTDLPLTLEAPSAGSLLVSEAALGFATFELLPCPEVVQLSFAWLSVAHAHGDEAPPTRLDLGSATRVSNQGQVLGVFEPAPNRFCALRVLLASPDDTATDPSLHVEGTRTSSGATTALELSTTRRSERAFEFDAALVLDDEHRNATLQLELDVPAWFARLSLDEADADMAREALDRVLPTARLDVVR